jgi:hypothetical protein
MVYCTAEVEVFILFQEGSDMLYIMRNSYDLFMNSVND